MTTLLESAPGASTVDLIVRRASSLYTLPAVAVEVLRLADHPTADVRDLRECLQQDPALTAKVLRVVNSSLFGLTHSIGDLNEAVGLLGLKQLKLLVLGFSLPELLFLDIAHEQLDWYWSTTLARAVAAREVSEQLMKRCGDEAFLGGMMQDLGVLVMLRELGAPYAALVGGAMDRHEDLAELEQSTMGFDHVQLTASLLAHWRMPEPLVLSIAEPRNAKRLARSHDEHAALARVLHLADLLAQLVGQHRLAVLPDLLEVGRLYCDLTKSKLHELVGSLEIKVRQLAGVLSLNAGRPDEYSQILVRAHETMSRLTEDAVTRPDSGDDRQAAAAASSASRETRPGTGTVSMQEIHDAVARYLNQPAANVRKSTPLPMPSAASAAPRAARETWSREDAAPSAGTHGPSSTTTVMPFSYNHLSEFDARLTMALGECRAARQPLSVVIVGVQPSEALPPEQSRTLDRVLDAAVRGTARDGAPAAAPAEGRRVLVLAACDRQEAIRAARGVLDRALQLLTPLSRGGQLVQCVAAAGVATIAEPPKNFSGQRLLETAERCLTAALTSGGVKSLEVI